MEIKGNQKISNKLQSEANAKKYDLLYEIRIKASSEKIWDFINTKQGLQKWWSVDIDYQAKEGFQFFIGFDKRAMTNKFIIQKIIEQDTLNWLCTDDDEKNPTWLDTTMEWQLQSEDENNCLLLMKHKGWKFNDKFFPICNTLWAMLLWNIQDLAEGKQGVDIKPLSTQ